MKIVDVAPLVLGGQFVLVRVITDDGHEGIGECSPMNAPIIASVIQHAVRPLLLNQNPMQIEHLVQRLHVGTYKLEGRTQAIAISGCELALWDLKGKVLGVPVYELLGGSVRQRVPVYATITRDTPARMVQRAVTCVESGFRALKLMVGTIFGFDTKPDTTLSVVKEVRDAVGEDIELMLDANSAWTVPTAIALCRRLVDYNIRYIEQPVPERDLQALAEVRRLGGIPVTFGEEDYSVWRYKDALLQGAADFVQPDPLKAGGLLTCKKIAILAEAFSRDCVPHNSQVNIGFAATLHLIASTPNCRGTQECWILPGREPDILRDELLEEPIKVVDGCVEVPTGPGLGVSLNHSTVAKFENVARPTVWPGAGTMPVDSGVPSRSTMLLEEPNR